MNRAGRSWAACRSLASVRLAAVRRGIRAFARILRRRDAAGRRLQPARTFAGLFALDFAFGRRLVFASLLTLAILGGFLATREASIRSGPSPDTIMAQQESPAFDSAAAQDNMLVTLTAYEQH